MPESTNLIVAVDGPAASGKSSICSTAATQLGLAYINTGSLYRAVGLLANRKKLTCNNEVGIAAVVEELLAGIAYDHTTGSLSFHGEDLTAEIRAEHIGSWASAVGKMPKVRTLLIPLQRKLAFTSERGAILDGRDIGTVIFPDAKIKVFLTASLEVRALRRLKQLESKNPSGMDLPTLEFLMEDMKKRDEEDSNRGVAPLKAASDSILLDSSELSYEQTVERLVELIKGC